MINKKLNYNVLWYLVPLQIVFIIFGIKYITNKTDKVFNNYPSINYNEKLTTVIISIDDYKGTTLLKDKYGEKFSVRAWTFDKKRRGLYYYIEPGDSIARKSMSDTLFLFKEKSCETMVFNFQSIE